MSGQAVNAGVQSAQDKADAPSLPPPPPQLSLQLGEDKRPSETHGFAKLPVPAPAHEKLSAEQILTAVNNLSQQVNVADDVRRSTNQLGMVTDVFQETLRQIESPQTRLHKAAHWGRNLREWVGLSRGGIAEAEKKLSGEITDFFQKDYPAIQGRILSGEKFEQIAADYPLIQRAAKKCGLGFKDTKGDEDIITQYGALIEYYRNTRNYNMVAAVSERVLAPEFADAVEKLPADRKNAHQRQAEKEVEEKLQKDTAELKNLSPEQKEQLREKLVSESSYQLCLKDALKNTFDPNSLKGNRKQVWESYNDSVNPRDEWFNWQDASTNYIVDELLVNAPLVVASGGTASLARAGISGLGRVALGRMALREAIGAGANVTIKELSVEGAKQIAKFGAKNALTKGAVVVGGTGGGLLIEGTVFELSHLGLQGEWLGSMPDWGSRILWSSAALGVFHGAGKVGERAFTKSVVEAGISKPALTALGAEVQKISNTAVREAAKELLVKGHVQASALLLIGAAQNGAFSGDINGFLNNFGEEVFHAYVTIGALKVGQAPVAIAQRAVMMPEVRVSEGEQGRLVLPKVPEIIEETRLPSDLERRSSRVDAEALISHPTLEKSSGVLDALSGANQDSGLAYAVDSKLRASIVGKVQAGAEVDPRTLYEALLVPDTDSVRREIRDAFASPRQAITNQNLLLPTVAKLLTGASSDAMSRYSGMRVILPHNFSEWMTAALNSESRADWKEATVSRKDINSLARRVGSNYHGRDLPVRVTQFGEGNSDLGITYRLVNDLCDRADAATKTDLRKGREGAEKGLHDLFSNNPTSARTEEHTLIGVAVRTVFRREAKYRLALYLVEDACVVLNLPAADNLKTLIWREIRENPIAIGRSSALKQAKSICAALREQGIDDDGIREKFTHAAGDHASLGVLHDKLFPRDEWKPDKPALPKPDTAAQAGRVSDSPTSQALSVPPPTPPTSFWGSLIAAVEVSGRRGTFEYKDLRHIETLVGTSPSNFAAFENALGQGQSAAQIINFFREQQGRIKNRSPAASAPLAAETANPALNGSEPAKEPLQFVFLPKAEKRLRDGRLRQSFERAQRLWDESPDLLDIKKIADLKGLYEVRMKREGVRIYFVRDGDVVTIHQIGSKADQSLDIAELR